ncbi:MAG: membrane protein insertase YidC [Pseudanabaenaceae cyanobacterium bins.68]|nr:membrane protein insertase YidC [Pseudanabaenaceae cyanobacterium bins.68]
MDFGVGFLSNNIMLPFLDWFYGFMPSYGLGIVALTLLVRFALFPVSANQIRNMRKMKIANPIMQQRQREIQEKYKNDPKRVQEEVAQIYKEFGNPLSGCLPALLQMPILFALFATLRGSPFADINYPITLQVQPTVDAATQVTPFISPAQNVYFADRFHYKVQAVLPQGNTLAVGQTAKLELQTTTGESFSTLAAKHPEVNITPQWQITKGAELVNLGADGTITTLKPGEVTVQATVPGLAASKGFLFIQALGKVGVTNPDGSYNWDILGMIIGFGLSLYISQNISSNAAPKPKSQDDAPDQQETMNKITPIIFSGMFLFFPLPAGVLMYMLIANIFQTLQSFLVSLEPLPENLQKIVDAQAKSVAIAPSKATPMKNAAVKEERKAKVDIPFEPGSAKKKKPQP